MTPSDQEFRDNLLGFETLDPQRQKQLEQQVRDMFEPQITGLRWAYWAMTLLAGLAGVWFFWNTISSRPDGGRGQWTAGWLLAFWLCLGMSALAVASSLYFMIRRRVSSRVQLRFGKLPVAITFGLVIMSFLYGCDDPVHKPEATWLGVFTLAAYVAASTVNIWNRIVAADRNAQERMMRIEYRLAELAEKISAGKTKQ